MVTNLLWIYAVIDAGITYPYQQVTLDDLSEAHHFLGAPVCGYVEARFSSIFATGFSCPCLSMIKPTTIAETRELLGNLLSTLAAEPCGTEPRHLRRLVNDGHLPRPVNGSVDAFEVLAPVLAWETEPAVVRKVLMEEVRRVRQSVSDTLCADGNGANSVYNRAHTRDPSSGAPVAASALL